MYVNKIGFMFLTLTVCKNKNKLLSSETNDNAYTITKKDLFLVHTHDALKAWIHLQYLKYLKIYEFFWVSEWFIFL